MRPMAALTSLAILSLEGVPTGKTMHCEHMHYTHTYICIWHGMVWYDMAWHGMAWYDMAWYGNVCVYIYIVCVSVCMYIKLL